MCPVALALRARPALETQVWVTGQHRHMLDQVLTAFGVSPDLDLRLMSADQSLAELSSRALLALDRCFTERRPDLVLVQGDTTTAFCAALAAFYRRIAVAHVEAGLRTWDLAAPFPEEVNRALITRARRPSLRPHGDLPGQPAAGGGAGPAHRGDRQHRHRRPPPGLAARGAALPARPRGQRAGARPGRRTGRPGHRPPARELRRRPGVDLPGREGAGAPVPRGPIRLPGAPEPARAGAHPPPPRPGSPTCTWWRRWSTSPSSG